MKRRAALAIAAILMMCPDPAIAETQLLPLPKITIRFATGTPQGIGLKVAVEVEVNQFESVRDNTGVLQDVVFLAGYDFLASARRLAPQAPSTTILKSASSWRPSVASAVIPRSRRTFRNSRFSSQAA